MSNAIRTKQASPVAKAVPSSTGPVNTYSVPLVHYGFLTIHLTTKHSYHNQHLTCIRIWHQHTSHLYLKYNEVIVANSLNRVCIQVTYVFHRPPRLINSHFDTISAAFLLCLLAFLMCSTVARNLGALHRDWSAKPLQANLIDSLYTLSLALALTYHVYHTLPFSFHRPLISYLPRNIGLICFLTCLVGLWHQDNLSYLPSLTFSCQPGLLHLLLPLSPVHGASFSTPVPGPSDHISVYAAGFFLFWHSEHAGLSAKPNLKNLSALMLLLLSGHPWMPCLVAAENQI